MSLSEVKGNRINCNKMIFSYALCMTTKLLTRNKIYLYASKRPENKEEIKI